MPRPRLRTWGVLAVAAGAALTLRCAGTSAPPAKAEPGAPRCVGTLGIDVRPLTAQVRRRLGLPADLSGVLVTEVMPGGPAAAEIHANDVVEEIGTARIGNECEFADAAFNRSCGPVRVQVWRAGARIEATLVSVDQAPFLEKACQDGIVSACFREGWLSWSRKSGGSKVAHALELFTAACKSGSADACAYASLQLMDEPDRSGEALAAAERACELGSGGGCANLAFLYATGKFVKRDDHRAATLYAKSCDLGDPQGCYNVALMADEGRGGPRDVPRAVARYDEACTLGSSTGCTNLGYLYENGHGVKVDKPRSVALYQRGCDGTRCQPSNLGGCVNVGRAYRDGIGVAVDEPRAATIFREACDRKLDPDDPHAAENGARACSLLGGLYIAGDGIPKDLTQGRELSELGCQRGDSFGCFNAAAVATDKAKADAFLELACKGGDGEGCFDLGVAYEKGNGVTADRRRAAELYAKACQLGFAQACAKKKR